MVQFTDEKAKEIFQKLDSDKGLEGLLKRARNSRKVYPDGVVIVFGYGVTGGQSPTLIYANREEYDARFKTQREQFNGRIMAFERGSEEYEYLTEIQDGADKHLHGKWVVFGYGPEANGNKPFVSETFETREDLLGASDMLLKKINERAIIHELGTTTYNLVDTGLTIALLE